MKQNLWKIYRIDGIDFRSKCLSKELNGNLIAKAHKKGVLEYVGLGDSEYCALPGHYTDIFKDRYCYGDGLTTKIKDMLSLLEQENIAQTIFRFNKENSIIINKVNK